MLCEEKVEDALADEKEVQVVEDKGVELSHNSVVELNLLKTMKIKGKIQWAIVIVLVDCEATHSILSQKLME